MRLSSFRTQRSLTPILSAASRCVMLPSLARFQPIQLVSFLLAHRDSFHPSDLMAVKRNFLLGSIRNFSLGRDTIGSEEGPVVRLRIESSGMRRLALVLVYVMSVLPSWSQSLARLTGTVADKTGAVVVGAKVTARNVATGVVLGRNNKRVGRLPLAVSAAGGI